MHTIPINHVLHLPLLSLVLKQITSALRSCTSHHFSLHRVFHINSTTQNPTVAAFPFSAPSLLCRKAQNQPSFCSHLHLTTISNLINSLQSRIPRTKQLIWAFTKISKNPSAESASSPQSTTYQIPQSPINQSQTHNIRSSTSQP